MASASPGIVREPGPEPEPCIDAPFELIAGAIVLAARVDGRPVVAMIDSGIPVSLIEPRLAAALGLVRHGAAIFGSEHGPVSADLVGPLRLAIGGRSLDLPTVIAADAPMLHQTGIGAAIVIGRDVLRTAVFEFDFEQRRLRASQGHQPAGGWGGYVRMPTTTDANGRVVVEVDLPVAGRSPAILDLGSNTAVMMSGAFARRHRLTHGLAVSTGMIATLGGVSQTVAFSLPSLAIGGLAVRDIPVDALPHWSSPQPINLGLEVLRQFRLVLDLANNVIWLRPIRGAVFDREMSGLLVAYRGSWLEVVHVARGSPAEQAGVARGAHILAIDGAPIGDDYFGGGVWRWRYGPAERCVLVGLRDRTTSLCLRRYY
ncbi:aspartyl protease family protein [Sphingomonas bacterium]|uniref:aspartyl protease family protein n=1 Tax=Sphingomonas bacterium TaxID=1895847 RepID=UPI0015769784|nr:aspartyl protease family protein [Sphingomonas bacterium]